MRKLHTSAESRAVFVRNFILDFSRFAESRAVAVAAGTNHSCVLLYNGNVMCWGLNSYGQLGIGNISQLLWPSHTVDLGKCNRASQCSHFGQC